MHGTLTARTNALLIAGTGILVACVILLAEPTPILALVIGAACGVVVGVLQSRGIAEAEARFRTATTALDVRRALMSTAAGKWAVGLQWACVAALVVTALSQGNAVASLIGGYSAFMCAREAATLRAVVQLGTTASRT